VVYAVPTILGELKRYFRDFAWAIHVPRGEKENVGKINRTVERLSADLGRSPTAAEIGAASGLSVPDVLLALETGRAARPSSLDTLITREDGRSQDVGDCVGREDDGLELVEHRDAIARSARGLSRRERRILYLRFVEDLTQAEIGARLGISQMHVSRLMRRALERSRRMCG
jgi:RNA polymerase sigma-B factor